MAQIDASSVVAGIAEQAGVVLDQLAGIQGHACIGADMIAVSTRLDTGNTQTHFIIGTGPSQNGGGCPVDRNGIFGDNSAELRRQINGPVLRRLNVARKNQVASRKYVDDWRTGTVQEIESDWIVGLERMGINVLQTHNLSDPGMDGLLSQPAATRCPGIRVKAPVFKGPLELIDIGIGEANIRIAGIVIPNIGAAAWARSDKRPQRRVRIVLAWQVQIGIFTLVAIDRVALFDQRGVLHQRNILVFAQLISDGVGRIGRIGGCCRPLESPIRGIRQCGVTY